MLEMYEWDNTWLEQAPEDSKPRVLYIGDSISCGIRPVINRLSNGRILFDGFGTSKAVDNPYFQEAVRLFGKQQRKRELVVFNNGLHGFHLEDTKEYRDYYEKMIQFLIEEFDKTKMALVLTTSTTKMDNERIIRRNEVVEMLAEKYRLSVIDLHSVSMECKDMFYDGVHFNEEGYVRLAKKLLESTYEILKGKNENDTNSVSR